MSRYIDLSAKGTRVRTVDPPTPVPTPPPVPNPLPAPTPAPAPRRLTFTLPSFDWHVAVIVLLLAVNGWQFLGWPGWHGGYTPPGPNPGPKPPSPVSGIALGKAFRGPLCDSLADAFDAARDRIRKGPTVDDADKLLQTTFETVREKAFADTCAPAFEAIVPNKSEPATPEAREAFAQLHGDFATGLRYRGK